MWHLQFKTNTVCLKAWKNACSAGKGKVQQQHEILQIFAEDPLGGKHFLSRLQEVVQSRKTSVESEWVGRKKLLMDIDESEAEEMIEDGTLLVRKNPQNPRRLQYKKVVTREVEEMTKTRKISGFSNIEVTADKMTGIMNKLQQTALSKDKLFGGCAGSSDDEDLVKVPKARKTPKDPKDPQEPKEPGKKKLKLDQPTVDSLDAEDEEGLMELTQKLSASMNAVSLAIKSFKIQFETTMYATPAKIKELKSLIDQCDSAKKKVDAAVVKGNVTVKAFKTSWEIYCVTKTELQKLEKIVAMDDVASTAKYSKAGKP